MHILILTDRDWTHPQAGGTGLNLASQVEHWLGWGHRVSVISCGYPGATACERRGALTLHHVGGRSTVFVQAIVRQARGLVPDPDVALEVINGVTFLTPLWLRTPRLALLHHIHRGRHYTEELGRLGIPAAFLLETAPLRLLYRRTRFVVVSEATAREVAAHGIADDLIAVNRNGVGGNGYEPGTKDARPTVLYLGRLKRYKHVERLLAVAEAMPGLEVEIAGDGDARPELEREIARRGLYDRVHLHGFVDEPRKVELLQRAWVHVTASVAEGWSLTVMEAAACGTPSVALATGGLRESIVDGETGLLARDGQELVMLTRRLVEDAPLRRRLGEGALARAGQFSWEGTAARTLALLEAVRSQPARFRFPRRAAGRAIGSETARAAGLAAAVMIANAIALVVTVAFARLLGAGAYGSLVALLAFFLILSVPGQALQATVAREVSSSVARGDPDAGRSVWGWLQALLVLLAGVSAASIIAREPLAAAIGVSQEWAAAAVLPTGCLWLLLCVERGVLQGLRGYRLVGSSLVGEAAARLLFGVLLVALGLGVTGAFLGTTLSILITVALLALTLPKPGPTQRRFHANGVRDLLKIAWVPLAALTLISVLQNIDVVVVKHTASEELAGSYAAAAVAAKAIIWVAVGLGIYLLPEATRLATQGIDARPVLARTLALVAAVAAPMILLYTVGAEDLLTSVFGDEFTLGAGALPLLAIAMTLLACAFLSVQYLLGLRRVAFLALLGVAALCEPLLLLEADASLSDVALALVAVQLALATALVAIGFRNGYALRSERAVA
ncbi:MAG: glycosyltransferase [Thermoleophilaceae bacterium]